MLCGESDVNVLASCHELPFLFLFANKCEHLSVLDPVMSVYHALYHLISLCLSEGSVISPLQRGVNNSQKPHC